MSENPSTLFELACQYMADGKTEKAIPLLWKAAHDGHPFAASNLGICFYFGDGVEQSFQEAFRCFEIALKSNDPTAFYYTARMHRFGEGRKSDARAALEYYTKAAMAGMPEAQCELAELYVTGESLGIRQDLRRAVHWFAYAAAQGHVEAEGKFNILYYHGYETSEQPTGFWFERESFENRKIPCSEPFSVLVKEGEYIADVQLKNAPNK
jgi:TPR repeat protein